MNSVPVAVHGIFIAEKKLLMAFYRDEWVLPGGTMLPNEDEIECLVRCVTEEQFPYCTFEVCNRYGVFSFNELIHDVAYWIKIGGSMTAHPDVEKRIEQIKFFSIEDLFSIKPKISKTTDQIIVDLIAHGFLT